MSQMLYRHPSVNKQNLEQSGYTKVEREKYDYIIVSKLDVDKYLKKGWWKTAKEAKNKEHVLVVIEELEDLTDSKETDEMIVYPKGTVNESIGTKSLKKVAKRLNVKFPPNIKDDTLLKKVRKALPTREELEQIANEMGIEYRTDIHDENLYEKISDVVKE